MGQAVHGQRILLRCNDLRNELASILPGPTPLVLEIGCGHGHFLTAYAEAHPRELCVGVDISLDRIGRARKKRDRAGLANLHFIRGEAREFLSALPAGTRIGSIFILFPDPWPKRRHHKNRLLEPGFLNALAERTAPGAPLYFRTDYEPYFADARAAVAAHPRWKLHPPGPWPFESPTVFQEKAAGHHSLAAERC